MATTCGAEYERYPTGSIITCQYPADHVPDHIHSWTQLRDQEDRQREADAKEAAQGIGCDDATPDDVKALLDAITAGNADPYLEAILAVTHNRKRTLRGTRGFRRL